MAEKTGKKKVKKSEQPIVRKTHYNDVQTKLTKRVNSLLNTPQGAKIANQIKNGTNKYIKYKRVENTTFDPRWLEEIEAVIPDLDMIIKNPKKIIETVTDVVPVELARKTGGESVKHLASHTQFVKEIDENGEVVPNKILNLGSDDFYATYENKFIATLIRKLVLFVEKRYQYMIEISELKETQILYFKNYSVVDGKKVEIETKVRVTNTKSESESKHKLSDEYLGRVEEARTYLHYYYNSEFMQRLKTEKNVRNPILMTNIIRKNKLYNNCYKLYKFIENYSTLGIDVKVDDRFCSLDENELNEIANASVIDFLALRSEETVPSLKKVVQDFKPKVLKSKDDEEFVFGDYNKGPFEFTRIDDEYLSYLEAKKNKLPQHLTKKEREYFSKEIEENNETKNEQRVIKNLLDRKKKELKASDKKFTKIVEEREKERIENKRLEEERKYLAKLTTIERARRALMKGYLTEEEEKIIDNAIKAESDEAPISEINEENK